MLNIITQHPAAVALVAAYFLIALVNTMPGKGVTWDGQTVYAWFYDFVHVLLNAAEKKYPALAEAQATFTTSAVAATTAAPAVPATSTTVIARQ